MELLAKGWSGTYVPGCATETEAALLVQRDPASVCLMASGLIGNRELSGEVRACAAHVLVTEWNKHMGGEEDSNNPQSVGAKHTTSMLSKVLQHDDTTIIESVLEHPSVCDRNTLQIWFVLAQSGTDDARWEQVLERCLACSDKESYVSRLAPGVERDPSLIPKSQRRRFLAVCRELGTPPALAAVAKLTRRAPVSTHHNLATDAGVAAHAGDAVPAAELLAQTPDRIRTLPMNILAELISAPAVGTDLAFNLALRFAPEKSTKDVYAARSFDDRFVASLLTLHPHYTLIEALQATDDAQLSRVAAEVLAYLVPDRRGKYMWGRFVSSNRDAVLALTIPEALEVAEDIPAAQVRIAEVFSRSQMLAVELAGTFAGTLAEFDAMLATAVTSD